MFDGVQGKFHNSKKVTSVMQIRHCSSFSQWVLALFISASYFKMKICDRFTEKKSISVIPVVFIYRVLFWHLMTCLKKLLDTWNILTKTLLLDVFGCFTPKQWWTSCLKSWMRWGALWLNDFSHVVLFFVRINGV